MTSADRAREALRGRLADPCCGECGHHVGKHHPAGGCDTTEYGPPEEGFPASHCACELDFADALLPVVVAEKAALSAAVEAAVAKSEMLTQKAMGRRSEHWRGQDYADGLDAGIEVTAGLVRAALADEREGGEQ